MTLEQCFLADIISRPDDDTPRLIFSDWLDENGQPARAAFIRMQCEIAVLEADGTHTRTPESYSICKECKRLNELATAEMHFIVEYGMDKLAGFVPTGTDCFAAIRPTFHRGFIEEIAGAASEILSDLDSWITLTPLRKVTLTTWPEIGHQIGSKSGLVFWIVFEPDPMLFTAESLFPNDYPNDMLEGRKRMLRLRWPTIKEWVLPASVEDGRRIMNAPDGDMVRVDRPVGESSN